MSKKRIALVVVLGVMVMATVLILTRDGDPGTPVATYVSSDGTLTFNHPADWEEGEETTIGVWLYNLPFEQQFISPDAFSVQIGFPIQTSQFSMIGYGTTPAEITQSLAEFFFATSARFSGPPKNWDDSEIGIPEDMVAQAENIEYIDFLTGNGYPATRAIFTTGEGEAMAGGALFT